MSEQSLIDSLAERMIGPESAEETLDRIEKYLSNPYLPPRTSIPMALAAIRNWRHLPAERSQEGGRHER